MIKKLKTKLILLQLVSMCLLSSCNTFSFGVNNEDSNPLIGGARLVTDERSLIGGEVELLRTFTFGAGFWFNQLGEE